jgi:ribonuclease HI
MSNLNFYVVKKGRNPGIYLTWNGKHGARKETDGFSGAVYKGFKSKAEALAWFNDVTKTHTTSKITKASKATTPSLEQITDYSAELQNGTVIIFADGACSNNPGKGGYAALLKHNIAGEKIVQGGFRLTTNNRMELIAVLEALKLIKGNHKIWVFSDSQYLIRGAHPNVLAKRAANEWIHKGTLIKNWDLWKQLHAATGNHTIQYFWVKGHSGQEDNEQVDAIARSNAYSSPTNIDVVFEDSQKEA